MVNRLGGQLYDYIKFDIQLFNARFSGRHKQMNTSMKCKPTGHNVSYNTTYKCVFVNILAWNITNNIQNFTRKILLLKL